MKTTLMTIALACASMAFAAQTPAPAQPATSGTQAPAASTVKKHSKKHSTKPAVKKNGTSTPAASGSSTPAPASTPAKK